jgi:hypothetical protein
MGHPEPVRLPGRRQLPEMIEIDPKAPMPPHSPRETALLKKLSGKSFPELVGEDADDADREKVLVWFKLRRLGYEPGWDEVDDILIDYREPDPQSAEGSTSSPPSAGSGG